MIAVHLSMIASACSYSLPAFRGVSPCGGGVGGHRVRRMSCSQCPHCTAITHRAMLRLPVSRSPEFYPRFAVAYRAARELSKQPAALIRSANPSLTPEQVKWYRRRCVELGLLGRVRGQTPPTRADAEVGRVAEPEPDGSAYALSGAELDEWLARAREVMGPI